MNDFCRPKIPAKVTRVSTRGMQRDEASASEKRGPQGRAMRARAPHDAVRRSGGAMKVGGAACNGCREGGEDDIGGGDG